MKSKAVVDWSAALFVFATVACWSGAVEAAVIWRADFETGNTSQWNGTVNAVSGARRNIEIVTDRVQQGRSAARFTIYPDNTFGNGQQRVQVTRNTPTTGEGQDTYMSWYILLPAEPLIRDNIGYFESSGSFRNMMTWWVAPKAGGGATINYGTQSLGRDRQWTADISLNTWHQIAVHIHWSVNPQVGAVKLFFDGVMVVDIKVQTKADANRMFFQGGYHRPNVSPLVDSIYVDNFLEADNLAEILAPPSGEQTDAGVAPDSAIRTGDDAGGGGPVVGTGGSGGGTAGASGGTGGSGGSGTPPSGGGTGGSGGGSPPPSGTGGAAPAPSAPAGSDAVSGNGGCAFAPGKAPVAGTLVFLTTALGLSLLSRRRGRRRG